MAGAALLVNATPAVARRPSSPRLIAIGLYVAVFAAVGAVAPYIGLYLQDLGLSLEAIGIFAAVSALIALVSAPTWGALADQALGSRIALVLAALGAAVMAAIVGLTAIAAVAVLFAVLYQLAAAGIAPILDAYTLDLVAERKDRYARFRVWGSASFVVSVVVVGILIQTAGLRSLFLVLIGSLLVAAILALAVPKHTKAHAARSFGGLREVLSVRLMATFLAATLIVWSANAMVNGFFSIYLVSLNAPTALVGSAWAIGALVEVPVMLAFPFLAARFGANRLIVVGAVAFLFRILVLVVSHDPYIATAAMALHGLGYALLLVGGVTYVAGLAPSGRAATAQGVFAGVAAGLANALGPATAGFIANASGIPAMFSIAAAISAVGVVAITLAVSWRRVDVAQPDPATAL